MNIQMRSSTQKADDNFKLLEKDIYGKQNVRYIFIE